MTPRVAEIVARLGTTVDFTEAAAVLRLVLGVDLSEATHRRWTYAAGTAALAVEETALQAMEQDPPVAAPPPDWLQLSIDATKVPLVHGGWTDAKLAVFADLLPGHDTAGQPVLEATNLSYAARWEPAERFGRTLTLEASRRGVDEAGLVVSPNDGADWIQGLLDQLAPQAVRILDEPHAAGHLGTIAGLVYGEHTAEAVAWTTVQRERLRTEPVAGVLRELARCREQGPRAGTLPAADGVEPAQVLAREVAYFQKRAEQISYAAFREAHYPIGSGIVESGHKVVIGQRFKGAGQHWAPGHLNPLLVLRTISCNDRWTETWPAIWQEQQRMVTVVRRAAQQARVARRRAAAGVLAVMPEPRPQAPALPPVVTPPVAPSPKTVVHGRPTMDHPWRRFSLGHRHSSSPIPKT